MKFIMRTTLGKTNMTLVGQHGPVLRDSNGLLYVEADTEAQLKLAVKSTGGPITYDGIGFDPEQPKELCVFWEQADLVD